MDQGEIEEVVGGSIIRSRRSKMSGCIRNTGVASTASGLSM